MAQGPLAGVKVLDLTWHMAGPFCSKLLADYGAEIIKIERPGTGDPARNLSPFLGNEPGLERSGLFFYLNTNKKSITLNLRSEFGRQTVRRLVQEADVLVESFSPGTLRRLGLGPRALAKLNPALVITSISNFGQTGPYRDYQATDATLTAMGGLNYVNGDPKREPLRPGGSQANYHAGMNAFLATLAAVYDKDVTGEGQRADISMMECIAGILEYTTAMYSFGGVVRKRWYSRHHMAYPHGDIMPCKDGYVAVPVSQDWAMLCEFMGHPELADERMTSLTYRMEHWREFEGIMWQLLGGKTRQEIFDAGQALHMNFTMVMNAEEIVNDPQNTYRGAFVTEKHPEMGPVTYPGAPVRLPLTPWRPGRAPLLGEHNREVYCDRLGYSSADLVRLRQQGAI